MEYQEPEVPTSCIYPITFTDYGKIHTLPVPLARITMCGMPQVEVLTEVVSGDSPLGRYEVISTQTLRGRGAVPSLTLLKLLVDCPHRFATNDWLMTHLREGDDVFVTAKRLENIVSSVRGLLCRIDALPRCSSALRVLLVEYLRNGCGSGPGYQLAPFPLVWVDTDALSYHVEHAALMERMGETALAFPFWQRACQLARKGIYLPDEPSSDWARATREKVEGHLRQSVHALAHHSLAEHGKGGEEEVILLLRTYWQDHKTDEDALRSLMELLGQRERFGEAEQYYQQCVAALDHVASGRQPTQQTRDIREFLRVKQIRRPLRVLAQDEEQGSAQHTPIIREMQRLAPASSSIQQAGNGLLDITYLRRVVSEGEFCNIRSDGLQEDSSWITFLHLLPAEQIALLISLLKRDANGMAHDVGKRETLRHIVAALGLIATGQSARINSEPWERLIRARMQHAALNEETLNHFEHLLGVCWDLSNTQALEVAEGVLSSFLPKILALPQKEGRIAIFASHGLRLWSILTHHRLDLANKVLLCEQSVDYARCAHDPNSLVPALIELASAYEYTDQPEKRFKVLQEALYNSAHASPLVQSRAYSRNAVVLAEGGREREAHFYIGLAREVFPDDPTKDPGFAFADSSIFRFSYHAGLVRVLTGEATRANDAFELYKQHPSGAHIPDRIRLEIANGESKAAILMNDAERYADLLEEVMIGSANIGSKKRFDEAYRIFRRQMPASWRRKMRIQILTEKYHLKREE